MINNINLKWQDLLDDMDAVAPMLRKFGYDPDDSNPIYGVPDGEVKYFG